MQMNKVLYGVIRSNNYFGLTVLISVVFGGDGESLSPYLQ